MTIRFAPAHHCKPSDAVIIRWSGDAMLWTAANDNGPVAANDEALLTQALRHFGNHGLGAAKAAADSALASRADGDDAGFARWLSVCRVLDRRLADVVARAAASGA